VRDTSQLNPGDTVRVAVASGTFAADVTETTR
jgi:ferredoxin-NADP reductase